jgi:hypothetical protein
MNLSALVHLASLFSVSLIVYPFTCRDRRSTRSQAAQLRQLHRSSGAQAPATSWPAPCPKPRHVPFDAHSAKQRQPRHTITRTIPLFSPPVSQLFPLPYLP